MSRIYRVLRKRYGRAPFEGEGSYRYGGRWSSPGVRLSYASEHQSLALLEYFVHLDQDDPPGDLVLAIAEVPDDLPRERVEPGRLPANWRDPVAPAALVRIGNGFVQRQEHCVLLVPSVLAPSEYNYLINPKHEEFKRIVDLGSEPLRYDPRMFGERRGRGR